MNRPPSPRSAILVTGSGATVVSWAVAWFTQLSPGSVPPSILAALVAAVLVGAGILSSRVPGGRWSTGAMAGATAAIGNLLVLGSLLSDGGNLAWIPGSIVISALLGAVGGVLGRRLLKGDGVAIEGCSGMAWVGVGAGFMLMILGGAVTSQGAGLAVPDYPNTYGYNMFLYPFAKMHGGVYFEHTHRLFGSLIGLVTIVLAIVTQRNEPRAWVRKFTWGLLAFIVVQGLMGGLRVDALLTGSTSPTDTKPVIGLAVAHGVFGQICLGLLVALAVAHSSIWKTDEPRRAGGAADRTLTRILVGVVTAQLTLGAVYRHLGELISMHIIGAMAVLALAVIAGSRLSSIHGEVRPLGRLGQILMIAVVAQIGLGFAALLMRNAAPEAATRNALQIGFITAHQTLGAAILAFAVAAMLLANRRLSDEPEPESIAPTAVSEI